MENLKTVPLKDLLLMMEISREILSAKNSDKIKLCLKKLQNLVLHDGSFVLLTNKSTVRTNIPLNEHREVDLPKELADNYLKEKYHLKSSFVNTVLSTGKPCHWKTIRSKNNSSNEIHAQNFINDYGYEDGWMCSTYYPNNQNIAFLTMLGKKVETDLRCATIIEYMTPYFAEAVNAVFFSKINKLQQIINFNLTPRQLEVLNWIKEGKTAWEISVILNRSERVIIWHANNILQKLGAQNRMHAVAIAMRNKLID